MTKLEIENYLQKLENKLLFDCEQIRVKLTREWTKQFSENAGVYVFRQDGEICYIGETGSIRGRMTDILNTQNHTIRRNVGKINFAHLPNFKKASSRNKFPENIEILVNELFETRLTVSVLQVELGRKELEEKLYDKFIPKYNQKGKRKKYTKIDKQLKYKNAYEPWTVEDDGKLENLFCEGKSTKELSKIFERNIGAINSRIKKLELKEKYGS